MRGNGSADNAEIASRAIWRAIPLTSGNNDLYPISRGRLGVLRFGNISADKTPPRPRPAAHRVAPTNKPSASACRPSCSPPPPRPAAPDRPFLAGLGRPRRKGPTEKGDLALLVAPGAGYTARCLPLPWAYQNPNT